MLIRKNLTNLEIFNTAEVLLEVFPADQDIKLPVKALFLLRKNMETFVNNAQEIEKARIEIIKKYGTLKEDSEDQYEFSAENLNAANKDLEDLFSCEQEVGFYTIPLDAFGDIKLSAQQMNSITLMIDFEEE